jgi:hypothetical protein
VKHAAPDFPPVGKHAVPDDPPTDPVGFPPIRVEDHMPTVPPPRRRAARNGTRRHRAQATRGQIAARFAVAGTLGLLLVGPSYAVITSVPAPAVQQVPPPPPAPLIAAPLPTTTTPLPARTTTKVTPRPRVTSAAKEAEVFYRNCTQLLLVSPPVERGEPGYRVGLDPDRDGVACE